MTDLTDNQITEKIIGIAMEIHRVMGPGLLEKVYELILFNELQQAGFEVRRQVKVPIHYNGKLIRTAFIIDILVQNRIVLEIKAVEKLAPSARSQLLTYLRLKHLTLGLILNFSHQTMREGIHRVVSGFVEPNPYNISAPSPSLN